MEQMGFQDQRSSSSIMGKLISFWHTILDLILSLLASLMPATEIVLNSRRLAVVKQLGEGGYSFVYLVKETSTGELYALKKVRCELPDQIKMLKQEILAHGKVKSDFVLPLVDSKVDSGQKTFGYLLLPYYGNGTVQDLIEQSKPMGIPIDKIASIGIDICNGLSAFQSIILIVLQIHHWRLEI